MLTKLLSPELIRRLAVFALAATVVTVMFSISLLYVFCGIFLGLSALYVIRGGRVTAPKTLLFFLSAYLTANIISLVVSSYPAESAKGVFRVFRALWLFLAVPWVLHEKKDLKFVVTFFVLGALMIGVDGLIQGMTGFEVLRHRPMTPYTAEIGRVTGPFRHANDFAAHLSLTLTAVLGLLAFSGKSTTRAEKSVLAVTALILAFNMANTYSRGGWVAALAALVLMILYGRSKILTALLAAALAAFMLFAPAPLKHRVASLADPLSGTLVERRELWQESIGMIRNRPLFGYGANTYARMEPEFKKAGSKTDFRYAHNGYLQMAAETGLAGLFSFLALLLFILASVLKKFFAQGATTAKAAACALCFGAAALLIHSATDTDLQSTLHIHALWLALGIGWAAKELHETSHP